MSRLEDKLSKALSSHASSEQKTLKSPFTHDSDLTRRPDESSLSRWSDKYFIRSREVVRAYGDLQVTYAVFMRRPVISAPRLAIEWLQQIAASRGHDIKIDLCFPEGKWVGAGEPILYITGSLINLMDTETLLLQKLGPSCVAAYNSYAMCASLPEVTFLAMDARHCAGLGMAELMAYAASVGSQRAQRKVGAKGFIGNATDATAHFFNSDSGYGTMPHALVGYAGSTVRAAEMFHETFPKEPLTVLVDYFGQEITDSLAVCARFSELAHAGRLSVRLDTVGGRFMEGLTKGASYDILAQHSPDAIRTFRTEKELSYLIGPGVSAAAGWKMRLALNEAGYNKVQIVGSSGFTPEKCRIIAEAKAPFDMIGTGSYLPDIWSETYATADIVDYGGTARVKKGREFLLLSEREM